MRRVRRRPPRRVKVRADWRRRPGSPGRRRRRTGKPRPQVRRLGYAGSKPLLRRARSRPHHRPSRGAPHGRTLPPWPRPASDLVAVYQPALRHALADGSCGGNARWVGGTARTARIRDGPAVLPYRLRSIGRPTACHRPLPALNPLMRLAAIILIVLALAYRLVPTLDMSWANFSPMTAIAFCGAVYFRDRRWSWLPFAGLCLSDIYINWFYAREYGYHMEMGAYLARFA